MQKNNNATAMADTVDEVSTDISASQIVDVAEETVNSSVVTESAETTSETERAEAAEETEIVELTEDSTKDASMKVVDNKEKKKVKQNKVKKVKEDKPKKVKVEKPKKVKEDIAQAKKELKQKIDKEIAENEKYKVARKDSLVMKLVLAVIAGLVVSALCYIITFVPIYKNNVLDSNDASLLNTVSANGKFIPLRMAQVKEGNIANAQKLVDTAEKDYEAAVKQEADTKAELDAAKADASYDAKKLALLQSNYDTYKKTLDTKTTDLEKAKSNLEIHKNSSNTNTLTTLVKDINIDGLDTSGAFYIDFDGKYLFNKDTTTIGQDVKISEVKEFIKQMHDSGVIISAQNFTYKVDGVKYRAAIYVEGTTKNSLIVYAEESDILSGLKSFYIKVAVATAIILALGVAIAILVARFIIMPIRRVIKVVERISDYDFTETEDINVLSMRKDEVGVVAKAVNSMRLNLRTILFDIDRISDELKSNADVLLNISTEVDRNSNDNSATSEELAASMQETSATSETIENSVIVIEENSSKVNDLTSDGTKLAKEIKDRAERLKSVTLSASQHSRDIYNEVKDKSEVAIEQSKAVKKINIMAKNIMEIASQTNLLSLNASIEAARAGDAGRGFAVVAGEIGKLAEQSTETVKSITVIVNEVQQAVNNMSDCLGKTLSFLDENVINDYDQFLDVSNQYSNDATIVENSMAGINSSMIELGRTVTKISEAIRGINETITDAADGVTDIAQKTSNTVALTADTIKKVEENTGSAAVLKETVDKFVL